MGNALQDKTVVVVGRGSGIARAVRVADVDADVAVVCLGLDGGQAVIGGSFAGFFITLGRFGRGLAVFAIGESLLDGLLHVRLIEGGVRSLVGEFKTLAKG